jgi:hypothetical protein
MCETPGSNLSVVGLRSAKTRSTVGYNRWCKADVQRVPYAEGGQLTKGETR